MRTALVTWVLLGGLAAQDSRPALCDELVSGDARRAELATRKAMLEDPAQLDRERLERIARGADGAAQAALRVLIRHGFARPQRPFAELPWETKIERATGSGEAAVRARRVIVWSEAVVPQRLWDSIAPSERRSWLELLIERPRNEALPLVRTVLAQESNSDAAQRLLGIAGLAPDQIVGEFAQEIVRGMLSADRDVFVAACAAARRLAPNVADGVIARLVRDPTTQQQPVQVLVTLGSRISSQGESAVLDFALRDAAPAMRTDLLTWLDGRGSAELAHRVEAALDGLVPLSQDLLERAGRHLDRPERIRKVAALLASSDARESEAACEALLRAQCFVPELLVRADAGNLRRAERLRRILALPAAVVPVDLMRKCLADGDPEVVLAACQVLFADPDLRGAALQLAGLTRHADPTIARAACHTLIARGDDDRARRAWESLQSDEDRSAALSVLVAQTRSFTQQVLAKELTRLDTDGVTSAEAAALQESLLVELAHLGSLEARERVVAGLTTMSVANLRRARATLAAGLRPREADAILALVADQTLGKQPQRRCELLQLLSGRPELVDVPKLRAIFSGDPDGETRLEALRLLLLTSEAAVIAEQLAPFLAGRSPLDDERKDEIYEYLGAFRLPLPTAGLEAVAQMLLLAPLGEFLPPHLKTGDAVLALGQRHDAEAEVRFPEQTMLAGLLVRSEPGAVRAALTKVAAEVLRHPAAWALSRARLLALLELLRTKSELLGAAGEPIAELLLWAPDPDETGVGVAHLVLGTAHEVRGDHANAALHLSAALVEFATLRLPARLESHFLGDVDLVAEVHPIAQLGARAHLAAARAAKGVGDRVRVEQELAKARSLAVGDRASEMLVTKSESELSK